ncbi:unnamed protein product [Hapterophycus canaliculatus]
MDSAPDSSSKGKSRQQKRGRHGEDVASIQEMQISIDSQSFVNLGQLMGSRHGGLATAASGGSSSAPGGLSRIALDDLGTSFLSDESDGLRDFDQIFHPAAEHGGSAPSPWPGRELYDQRDAADCVREEGENHGRDDDDDSLLPALPSRSSTPGSPRGDSDSGSNKPSFAEAVEAGWAEEDFSHGAAGADACGGGEERAGFASFGGRSASATVSGAVSLGRAADLPPTCGRETTAVAAVMKPATRLGPTSRVTAATDAFTAAAAGGSTAAGAANNMSSPLLRESWLHVPMGDDGEEDGDGSEAGHREDAESRKAAAGEEERAALNRQQCERYRDAAAAAARARRAAARALGDCGDCLAHGAEKAAALARVRLEGLARALKARVEAGTEACARGQEAVVKAVDSVPQAPVRVWLGRIAGSLVLGAILGGAVAFYAFPKAISTGSAGAAADSTSPWWTTVGGGGGEPGAGGAEPNFGDRLNMALFAARAGEAAAQQGLLEEVRNILAATGKGGGISAEQILRQFNAKRFKEASKAWSRAEGGNIVGSDPLDPLFFAPPSTPVYPSSASASQQQQQQQQQQPMQQQPMQQQPMPQQPPPSIPPGAAPATECAGGASGSAFCSKDGPSDPSAGGASGSGGAGGGGDPSRTVYARADTPSTATGRPQYRRPCPGGWVC